MRVGEPVQKSEAEEGQSRLHEADDSEPNHQGSCTESWAHTTATHPILTFQGLGEVCPIPASGGWGRGEGGASCRGSFLQSQDLLCHLIRWQHQAGPQDKCPQCVSSVHPSMWWIIMLFHVLLKKTFEWPVVYLNIYIVIQSAGSVTACSGIQKWSKSSWAAEDCSRVVLDVYSCYRFCKECE